MTKTPPVSTIGERPLIARLSKIFNSARSPEIILGAGADDCAVIDISDEDCLVVTTDMLHRTTDFPPQMSPWQIGWMAAAVNLSDVASMGARPVGVLSALGFPADTDVGFVEEIARGMADCAKACGTTVIGGDIDTHDELTITGTAIGRVKKSELLTRRGARVGDKVCVTGYVGSAGAALRALETGAKVSDSILRALFEPMPQTDAAQGLAGLDGGGGGGAVTSMMDTSDGLAMSLHDLADAGGVGFKIYENALPIADEVRIFAGSADGALELALYTGGDFGLLFTVRSDMVEAARGACDLNVIGEVVEDSEGVIVELVGGSVELVYRKGYEQLASKK
ncbi:MAG: thiamine-phosphate kinase [Methanosarcinaceae archaeon]|nr:thiamine-phosphate kinase [Methanosarcinaceae archaeon]